MTHVSPFLYDISSGWLLLVGCIVVVGVATEKKGVGCELFRGVHLMLMWMTHLKQANYVEKML